MTLVLPGPELQVHIRAALKEDIRTRDRDLAHIKDWLRKQPHLPDTWEDQRLMTFLRGCSFSLEKCKRKLDMYFTMRAALPEFFTDRDVARPELRAIAKMGQGAPLPGLTADGKRVTIVRAVDINANTPNFSDVAKIIFMMGDIRLAAEQTGVAGDIYILDASVATVRHFAKIPPVAVKKFMTCVQQAYPVKIKAVHVINATPFVDFLFNWVKPFVKEKIMERVTIHKSLESLYEAVPRDILPEEYGGTAGKLQDFTDAWIRKMEEYRPWFKEQENVKADERLRPGKPSTYEDLFGFEGSFKQLSID